MTMYWDTKLKHLANREPGKNDTAGLFLLCAARPEPGPQLDRCDYDTWGPVGPVRTDDPRYASLFGSGVISTTHQLLIYDIVFALPPDGFVIYIEVATDDADRLRDTTTEDHLVNMEDPPCAARTLHELFRLMWEWTQVTYEPFTNDEVAAVTAANILARLKTDLGLTDTVLDEVVAAVPPMQIARYLAGDSDARRRPPSETIPPAPQSFLDWLESTCEPIPEPDPV